jgi:dipeptidyl aminopeptidase/acylaminoacyl peptidase
VIKGITGVLSWIKKGTKAVYMSGRDEVRLLDLKTMESRTIVRDEIWVFREAARDFRPMMSMFYLRLTGILKKIFLFYNIKENKSTDLTNTGITESGPLWSPDGKYIYFTSQRLKAAYPFGMPNARVYRVPLEKLDDPYRMDKFNELFREEKKGYYQKSGSSFRLIG